MGRISRMTSLLVLAFFLTALEVWLENIDISVRDATVTLSGTVPSRAAADAVVQAAEVTMGVKEVEDRLAVQREDVRVYSDLEIKAMVMDQLYWDSRIDERRIDVDPNVRVEDINVVVEDGRVTLSGVVLSRFSRQAAYEAATEAYSVTEVENNIFVGS